MFCLRRRISSSADDFSSSVCLSVSLPPSSSICLSVSLSSAPSTLVCRHRIWQHAVTDTKQEIELFVHEDGKEKEEKVRQKIETLGRRIRIEKEINAEEDQKEGGLREGSSMRALRKGEKKTMTSESEPNLSFPLNDPSDSTMRLWICWCPVLGLRAAL